MSEAEDPPRLRTLAGALPAELVEELRSSPDEEAPPAELERLQRRVRAFVAAESAGQQRSRSSRRVFRGTLGLGLTFAIGAAAGVLVSAGLYFEERLNRPPQVAPIVRPWSSARAPNEVGKPLPRGEADSSGGGTAAVASASSPARPAPAPKNVASSPAPDEGVPYREDEFALLRRAQAVLERDPRKALVLAGDHERKFPGGAFAQEREVVAIDALLLLGRRAEAQARADRFHRQWPDSVHGRRVDVLFGVR
ncbi:MAG TPA: hypothetical protein VGK73_15410 [Polyangiaceae bacterium]